MLSLLIVLSVLLLFFPLVCRVLDVCPVAEACGPRYPEATGGSAPFRETAAVEQRRSFGSGGVPGLLPPPAAAGPPRPEAGTAAEAGEPFRELIDIGRIEGRVKASSVRRISEIAERHPQQTLAILRRWMYEAA